MPRNQVIPEGLSLCQALSHVGIGPDPQEKLSACVCKHLYDPVVISVQGQLIFVLSLRDVSL